VNNGKAASISPRGRRIRHADFQVLPGLYAFAALARGPAETRPEALACVRDGNRWSELIPASDGRPGRFKMFSFHFDPGYDATGFVGWLHSHLARATGTGHIVICGSARREGAGFDHVRSGIFDYWGCPADRAETVIAEVRALIAQGRRA
jgi:hypothetical protein